MSGELGETTKAILLLTAPLLAGRRGGAADGPKLLTPTEYLRLARRLVERRRQPADLLQAGADELIDACSDVVDRERMKRLLARGMRLSQAIERWTARSIWVASRADAAYPSRVRARLRERAPPLFFGCGDARLAERGGLAVVGSRDAGEAALALAASAGRLAAGCGATIVSGGARGIDQAAMSAALESGGSAIGVLADSLESAALSADHRDSIGDGRLLLLSPNDPAAGFQVGLAMARNKLIYALADAALVASSDVGSGGTWAGAIEQLEALKLAPLHVPDDASASPGLRALRAKGALPWPRLESPAELRALLDRAPPPRDEAAQVVREPALFRDESQAGQPHVAIEVPRVAERAAPSPSDRLLERVVELMREIGGSRTAAAWAKELDVQPAQMSRWLRRLVADGTVEKRGKPVGYALSAAAPALFDSSGRPVDERRAAARARGRA